MPRINDEARRQRKAELHCADCGGRLKCLGEDVTEELYFIPSRDFLDNCTVRSDKGRQQQTTPEFAGRGR